MDVSPGGGVGPGVATPPGQGNLRGLDPDAFFQLLITELQNQDPLDPLDNTQLLQQVATIRQVGVSLQLTQTLQALMRSQRIASAASLLGRQVRGLSEQGQEVTGTVQRVTIEGEKVLLHVGEEQIHLANVSEILPEQGSDDSN